MIKNSEVFLKNKKCSIPKGIVYFTRDNILGKLINNCLTDEFCKHTASEMKSQKTEIWFSDSFYNKKDGRNTMLYISKEASDAINSLVKDYMLLQLLYLMQSNKLNGISKKQTIERFLRFYKITSEEYSYDAAKKSVARLNKTMLSIDSQ